MIIDAKDIEDETTLSTDICICGAGAAGITLALDLMDSGLDVVLLEGGSLNNPGLSEPERLIYRGEVEGLPIDLPEDRARGFGGTTSKWGGWCIPLEPDDFKYDGYPRGFGWPIGYSELEPYYRRAQKTCNLGHFEYEASTIAEREDKPLLEVEDSKIENIVYQFSEPTHFGEMYRPDLEYSSEVRVYTNANLMNISQSKERGHIERFDCKVIDGASFTVEANNYVLAMGGIENPRLLLASDNQSPNGLANENGLVGRFFMQHPHFSSPAFLLMERFDDSFYKDHATPTREKNCEPINVDIRGALKVTSEQLESMGLPNAACTLHSIELNRVENPYYQIAYQNISSLPPLTSSDLELYRLYLRAEQKPLKESKVELSDDRDPLGIPRVSVDWRVSQSDRSAYRRYLETLCKEISKMDICKRYWILFDEENQFRHPSIWGGGHHMGTTRMSKDPRKGVVNANCRAHNIKNLYISGSSVFPTGGYANPTLTIVALAHRLSDHLSKKTRETEES